MSDEILTCNFGGLTISIRENRAGFLPKLSTDSVSLPAPTKQPEEKQKIKTCTLDTFRNKYHEYDFYECTITCNWKKFKNLITFEQFYLRVSQAFTKSIIFYGVKELPYDGSRAIHIHGIIVDKRKKIGTEAYKKAHTSFRESQKFYDGIRDVSRRLRKVGHHTIVPIRDKFLDYKLQHTHYISSIPGDTRQIGNLGKYWEYMHKTIETPDQTKSICKGIFNSGPDNHDEYRKSKLFQKNWEYGL
jgi:hypothetical protein